MATLMYDYLYIKEIVCGSTGRNAQTKVDVLEKPHAYHKKILVNILSMPKLVDNVFFVKKITTFSSD